MSGAPCGCAPLGNGLTGAEIDRLLRDMDAGRDAILRAAGLGLRPNKDSHSRQSPPGEFERPDPADDLPDDLSDDLPKPAPTLCDLRGECDVSETTLKDDGTKIEPYTEDPIWTTWTSSSSRPSPTTSDFVIKSCSLLNSTNQTDIETIMMAVMEHFKIPSGAFALLSPCELGADPITWMPRFSAPRLMYAGGFTHLPSFAARGFPEESPAESAEYPYSQPTSLFRIASISKVITSLGVMRAVERGLLDLDETAQTYFPDFIQDGRRHLITIRHLLTHTSGLPHAPPNDEDIGELPVDRDTRIAYMAENERLEFTPGSDRLYSNYGMTVLERILEEVTGMTYPAWVRSQVLLRTGMRRTTPASTLTRASGEVCYYDNAVGCDCSCDDDCSLYYPALSRMSPSRPCVRNPYGRVHYEAGLGPAGWLSCVKDLMSMVKWFIMAWHDKAPTFLSRANARAMLEPSPIKDTQGLGWGILQDSTVPTSTGFGHDGRMCGTVSSLWCNGVGSSATDNRASLVYVFNAEFSRADRDRLMAELSALETGDCQITSTRLSIDFSAPGDLFLSCST